MDSVAALGLDHVRVFPLWETLQPNRTLIRQRAVDDVVAVVDAATEAGLDTSVDAIQGHLSSFDFLPSWVLSWHRRNVFTDAAVIEAQERLVTTLGSALSERPGFLGFTIGNETNQFAKEIHPSQHPLDPDAAQRWLARLLHAAAASAPGARHAHSFDDDVWFGDASAFTPAHAVDLGDITTVHSWVFTAVAQHFPVGHPAFAWFARYLLELATAWAGPADRTIWLQEVGAPTPHLGETAVVPFATDTLRHAAAHPGLWGITWWCSHDVDRSLADFPELEYSLGLLAADRSIKPLGRAVRDLLPELREAADHAEQPAETMVLPCDDHGRVLRSSTAPGSPFFAEWIDAAASGTPPRLELPVGGAACVLERAA